MGIHIHITGAQGAGKTTLGDAVAERLNITHIDTDSFFWELTDPPYQKSTDEDKRRILLASELYKHSSWALSGSLRKWGDVFVPLFDLVILIITPTSIRLKRLQMRQLEMFGERIRVGGDMHMTHTNFMSKAKLYDELDNTVRSLKRDTEWLATLPCQFLCINGSRPLNEILILISNEFMSCQELSKN